MATSTRPSSPASAPQELLVSNRDASELVALCDCGRGDVTKGGEKLAILDEVQALLVLAELQMLGVHEDMESSWQVKPRENNLSLGSVPKLWLVNLFGTASRTHELVS